MDIYSILMCLCVIGIFILIGKLKSNYKKAEQGRAGEAKVAKSLNFWMKKRNKTYVYNDLTLPTRSGRTTQIDHLVLSRKGLFVIETKNLNGKIYADIDKPQWKHINRKGMKNDIYNPIFQNNGHIGHLAALFDEPNSSFTGIVTNIGSATIKGSVNPLFGKCLIERGTGFVFRMWRSQNRFDQAHIDHLVQIVEENKMEQSSKTNKTHLENVRRKKKWKLM